MSTAQQAMLDTQQTSSSKMIATLGLVAAMSGFLVVLIFQFTLPMINENKRIAIENAVFKVVPQGGVTRKTFVVTDTGLAQPGEAEGTTVYAAYAANGTLLGLATESAAQGYADMVRIIYGYDPSCQCITGFTVIKMTETPGLGDKITRDQAFQANFDALDARVNATGDALANPIRVVKHGSKKNPWEIDAISGATISSKAVGKAIGSSAEKLIPLLHRYLPEIARASLDGGVDNAKGAKAPSSQREK